MRSRFLQQIQNLRANRDIQRRDDLVADDEFGLGNQRTGDADALTLTAAEGMRKTAQMFDVQY